MNLPFVSIVVPVYNSAPYIENCIDSLLRLNYPKENYEVIMVDNNSTDLTATTIKKYPVVYALQDRVQTSYAARNTGIKMAKGEILAFTDADCIADEQWILNGVKPFANNRIGGVGGQVKAFKPRNYIERFQDRKNVFGQEKHLDQKSLSQRIGKIVTCNAFYRRDVFAAVGLFARDLVSGGDHDLSLRVQKETNYTLQYAPDAIVYHQHRTSLVQFWKQYYKYGLGRIYLAEKHKKDEFSKRIRLGYSRQIYWYLKTLSPEIKEIFKIGFTKKNELKETKVQLLGGHFLMAVSKLAYLCGMASSAYKNKVPYFDTIF
jgi:cellulose synthase/poly-beta-1,6-N-acetylglucosamine synthase-like glycosyltransferase